MISGNSALLIIDCTYVKILGIISRMYQSLSNDQYTFYWLLLIFMN